MKYTLGIFFLLALFSCKNETNNSENQIINYYNLPDSTNYEYKMLENGLLEIFKFYPGTKRISEIFFLNKKKLRDSTAYYYDRNGMIETTIQYKDDMKIKNLTVFYKNGNIHRQGTFNKNNIAVGEDKWFYENGKPRKILEYLLRKDSLQFLNNSRYFDKQGEIIKDSTYFIQMLTNKDTVSLNDSIKVSFNVILPEKPKAFKYFGNIDEDYGAELPPSSEVIKDSIFYYKPKKSGKNLIEIVFVIVFDTTKYNSPYSKVFLKKDIFVTK